MQNHSISISEGLVLCRRFGEDEVNEDRWKMLKDTVVVVVIKVAATKERQVLGVMSKWAEMNKMKCCEVERCEGVWTVGQ